MVTLLSQDSPPASKYPENLPVPHTATPYDIRGWEPCESASTLILTWTGVWTLAVGCMTVIQPGYALAGPLDSDASVAK
jgi:hypothetical protein